MGGPGSTRWGAYTPKRTVEGQLELSMWKVIRQPVGVSVVNTWTDRRQRKEVGQIVVIRMEGLFRTLYSLIDKSKGEKKVIDRSYPLTPYTGIPHRYYTLCPECGRRCDRLYLLRYDLAAGLKCRKCHDLVYYSAQSHSKAYDWLFKEMREGEKWLKKMAR